MRVRDVVIAIILLAQCSSARAQDVLFRKDSILFFGGVYSSGNMGQSLNPFYKHESNYVLGAAYGRDLIDLALDFVVGAEVGVAGRFGDGSSAEVWGGPSIRHRGIPIGDLFAIAPGLIVGLSAVTRPIGIEREQEIKHNGNATLLFYFSPELAFLIKQWPNTEIVYRLHHRSGLNELLGKMREGSNAHVLGLRWRM